VFANYIDNVTAFVNREKRRDPITNQDVDPDERLMRSIEEKADVSEQHADDFRRQIIQFMYSHGSAKGKVVKWDTNPRLSQAIRKKVFEEVKDHIKISQLSSAVGNVNKDLQDKIDAVRARMVANYGYTDRSAQDVLYYVSQIFSRGDIAEQ
jgi:serine protein kinase